MARDISDIFDHKSSTKSGDDAGGGMAEKHVAERHDMQGRHEAEHAAIHSRHEDEHKKSSDGMDAHGRHAMHARHAAERREAHHRHAGEHDQMAGRQMQELAGATAIGNPGGPGQPGQAPALAAAGGAMPTNE